MAYSPEEASRRRKGMAMLAASGLALLFSLALVAFQFGWFSFEFSGWLNWDFWNRGSGQTEYVRLNVDRPTPAPVPGRIGLSAAELAELRRVQQEHLRLIDSIEPTATLPPSEESDRSGLEARQAAAQARVRLNPDGVLATKAPGEDWFDARRGLYFAQENGGDWTTGEARAENPYSGLFYYEYYPDSVDNFGDRSIYPALARELAFKAVELLPPLVEVTPHLIDLMSGRVGWQLREGAEPIVNIWTTFAFVEEGQPRQYAVGGVMRMGVAYGEVHGQVWEYVVLGDWIGPVALERLE